MGKSTVNFLVSIQTKVLEFVKTLVQMLMECKDEIFRNHEKFCCVQEELDSLNAGVACEKFKDLERKNFGLQRQLNEKCIVMNKMQHNIARQLSKQLRYKMIGKFPYKQTNSELVTRVLSRSRSRQKLAPLRSSTLVIRPKGNEDLGTVKHFTNDQILVNKISVQVNKI